MPSAWQLFCDCYPHPILAHHVLTNENWEHGDFLGVPTGIHIGAYAPGGGFVEKLSYACLQLCPSFDYLLCTAEGTGTDWRRVRAYIYLRLQDRSAPTKSLILDLPQTSLIALNRLPHVGDSVVGAPII